MFTPDLCQALAPTGRLRAALNFANTIVVQKGGGDGQQSGVAVEIACELARCLGVELDLNGFDNPTDVVEAMTIGAADIGFVAREPSRADLLDFTQPYVQIESTYLVPIASDLQSPSDADRPGLRIAVMTGAAFDLHLTRTLTSAQLVRGGPDYLDALLNGQADVAAGIRQVLDGFAQRHSGLRVMPGHIAKIDQSICLAKGNPGSFYVDLFVGEMKASGFIAKALAASGQSATVPPPSLP